MLPPEPARRTTVEVVMLFFNFFSGFKLKKMLLPFLVGVIMKGASLLPVILGGMKLMAVQALLASKTALLLTSLLGKQLIHLYNHNL